jgi:hypothetical protein
VGSEGPKEPVDHDVMNPWFITGLTEAEGSFTIKIDRRKSLTFYFVFRIEMIKSDHSLLLKVKNFLNCGTLEYSSSKNSYVFGVYNSKHIEDYIFPHFNKF